MYATMPLLPTAAKRIPKETLSVRLDPSLIEKLDEYCEFIGNGRQDVIQNALTYIFDQDNEFHTWAQERTSKKSPR
jgi:metal-responsive CopG/Arc/MetJ family transcriptional regulator